MLWFFLLFLITFIFLPSGAHDNFSFLVGSFFLNSGARFHRLCHFPDSNTVEFILSVTCYPSFFLCPLGARFDFGAGSVGFLR